MRSHCLPNLVKMNMLFSLEEPVPLFNWGNRLLPRTDTSLSGLIPMQHRDVVLSLTTEKETSSGNKLGCFNEY